MWVYAHQTLLLDLCIAASGEAPLQKNWSAGKAIILHHLQGLRFENGTGYSFLYSTSAQFISTVKCYNIFYRR